VKGGKAGLYKLLGRRRRRGRRNNLPKVIMFYVYVVTNVSL
jgi:hypothetical protein